MLKKATADELKVDNDKRKKDKAITREEAANVSQLTKEQKELEKSNLSAQKKEKEQKQAIKSIEAKGKKHQDEEGKKRVTAAKTQGSKKVVVSPRHRSTKRCPTSPTSSVSLVVTQGGH